MATVPCGLNWSALQESHMTVSHIETPGVQQREGLKAFLAARQFLLQHREDYETVYRDFRWPNLDQFNWALNYFDSYARDNNKPALWIVDENGPEVKLSFAEMSRRSNQVANFLRRQGVRRGDRIIVQLPNVVAIWEIMLAALKLGAVVIPAATLLTVADLRDRLERGKARHVVTLPSLAEKLAGHLTRKPMTRVPTSLPTATLMRPILSCCISRPARPPCPSSCFILIKAIPSATSLPCFGSASVRTMCT
jgi:hypothetical protein